MQQLNIGLDSLVLACSLVLVALAISRRERLGLEKDLLIASVRMVVQLGVVGYVLLYLFQWHAVPVTVLMQGVIVFNASLHAAKRSSHMRHAFRISLASITLATGLCLAILVGARAVAFIPEQIVPLTGMIAGNTMQTIGLCYRNMHTFFHDRHSQVLEMLALGATVRQSAQGIMSDAIRAGMQPTIDSAKTVGLVALPGMMSGLIFAGVPPTTAIMYQIMIFFMLIGGTATASLSVVLLSYRSYFTSHAQLQEHFH